jgi:hypothetical protein
MRIRDNINHLGLWNHLTEDPPCHRFSASFLSVPGAIWHPICSFEFRASVPHPPARPLAVLRPACGPEMSYYLFNIGMFIICAEEMHYCCCFVDRFLCSLQLHRQLPDGLAAIVQGYRRLP